MKACPFCKCRTSRCCGCDDPAPIGTVKYCEREDLFPHEGLGGSSHWCAGCFRFVSDDLGGVRNEDGTESPLVAIEEGS